MLPRPSRQGQKSELDDEHRVLVFDKIPTGELRGCILQRNVGRRQNRIRALDLSVWARPYLGPLFPPAIPRLFYNPRFFEKRAMARSVPRSKADVGPRSSRWIGRWSQAASN